MTIEELKKAKSDMEFEIAEAVQKFIDNTGGIMVSEVHLSLGELMDGYIVEEVKTSIIL